MEHTQPSEVAVVIVKDNGTAHLKILSCGDFVFDDELFAKQSNEPQWFGFYDWLRASSGDLLGICLRPDEGELPEKVVQFLVSLDASSSSSNIYIFFGETKQFDAAKSDDADFGGNLLFQGNRGSIAIAFNTPNDYP